MTDGAPAHRELATSALPEPAPAPEVGFREGLGRWAWLVPSPQVALGLLLLASLLCRIVWLTVPQKALIFDETYYVNAARVMIGDRVPHNAPYAGRPVGKDPNAEHPPLAKLLMAGSMRVLGDNAFGWRLPSIVAGLAAIALLYLTVTAAGGDPWLGVLAATLFSLDNLVLVHSRIGTLDMPLVAFLLLGAWLALRDRPLAAGAALGVATLVKLNGTYGLAAILLLLVGRAAWERRENGAWPRWPLRWGGLLIAGYLPTWFVGLWLLDLWVGTYHTPWEHLSYMLRYGFALTRPGGPANDESYPWQWLINEVQMTYYRVDVNTLVNGKVVATRPQVYFRGAMNPVIIGAASLGFWYAASRAWRYGERLSIWVVAWTIATYLPFYPVSMLEHRTSYIFYFLPTIPAVCVGLALLLREAGLPRTVMWGFLLAALIGFIGYFPFRTIL